MMNDMELEMLAGVCVDSGCDAYKERSQADTTEERKHALEIYARYEILNAYAAISSLAVAGADPAKDMIVGMKLMSGANDIVNRVIQMMQDEAKRVIEGI